MTDYPFPAVGVPGNRIFNVGSCRVCGLGLCAQEENGPPEAQDICSVCDKTPRLKPKRIKTKTEGEMLLDRVSSRHKDCRGISSVKIPTVARDDLIDEINTAIGLGIK